MQYEWALPVGHKNAEIEIQVGRTFQQPVPDRDDTKNASYIELYMNPNNNGAVVYAMMPGSATYRYRIDKNGNEIGEITIQVLLDFALELQNTNYFKSIIVSKIIYNNISHQSFLSAMNALVRYYHQHPNAHKGYNIINTKWKNGNLLTSLGTNSSLPAFETELAEFINSITQQSPANALPFIIAAGDEIGVGAGYDGPLPDIAPHLSRMVKVSTVDAAGQYFDTKLLYEALLKSSNGRLQLNKNFVYLSGTATGTGDASYDSTLATKLGVTKTSVHEALITINGRKQLPLANELFTWHHGAKSFVEWKYDEGDDFKLKVRVRDKALDPTAPNDATDATLMRRKAVLKKKGQAPTTVTIDYNIDVVCGGAKVAGKTPLDLCLDYSAVHTNYVTRKYAQYKSIIDNYGLILEVPAEIMLAISYQESGGDERAVRFEPLRDKKKLSGATLSMRAKKQTLFEAKYRALTAPKVLKRTVIKGKEFIKLGRAGHSTIVPDFSDAKNLELPIRTIVADPKYKGPDLTMTWQQFFDYIDLFGPNDKVNTKWSPGVGQTLIATAYGSLQPVQTKFSTKLAELGLLNAPKTSSEWFKWLLVGSNSFKAMAAKLRGDYHASSYDKKLKKRISTSTKWDLPLVDSRYNDGGTPTNDYQSSTAPNPWGYYVDSPEYFIHTAQVFNAARSLASSLGFACTLVKDTSN